MSNESFLKTTTTTSSTSINTADTLTKEDDCDYSNQILINPGTMPSLIHNPKRKRLDAVLSMLSTKQQHYDETFLIESINEQNTPIYPQQDSLSQSNKDINQIITKLPKKQLSLDSEMSMNVENLNLNIGNDQQKLIKEEDMDSQECIPSTTSTNEILMANITTPATVATSFVSTSMASTTTATATIIKTASSCNKYSTNSKDLDSLTGFNTSSDLLASSTSISALFSPPTSNSAGGTVEIKEEENDEETVENEETAVRKPEEDVIDEVDRKNDLKKDEKHGGQPTDTTTTVTMASEYLLQDGDNLFGSHRLFGSKTATTTTSAVTATSTSSSTTTAATASTTTTTNICSAKERILKKLPQAKLLSHELALSLATAQQPQSQQRTGKCQNALVPPDSSASSRTSADSAATKMAQTLVPVGLSESVTSTSHCLSQYYSETLFHKLPLLETIASNASKASASIPICKCLNCQLQKQMPSSMIQSTMVNSSEQHSQPHSWSWHNLIKSSPDALSNESFITLLSAAANENSLKYNVKNKKLQPPSPLSSQSARMANVNKMDPEKNGEQNKKRSYSDSDVLLDYFNINQIQQLQQSINAGYHTGSAQYLPQTESGLIVKNGRSMPKPLHKKLLVQSEHSTPQDSPLDLSVKSLNAQLINESDPHSPYHHYDHYHHQYSNLFKKTKKIPFNNSCSVPSLTTIPYTLTKQHFQYSQTSVFQPNQSFKIPKDEVFSSYKRRNNNNNNSQSESISSSSMSSLVTSPQYPTPGTSLKLSKSDDPVPMCGATATAAGSDDKLDISQSVTSASIVSLTDILSKSFTCTICGQTFTLHDRLAKHIASRHKNRQQCDSVSKNYLCEICQRSFARSDMLTRHMRLHTGIKPYTCKICDQVFSRSDHLSTHQRTHTGEKPYKCPQCPYAACRRDMITRHMRTHSRHYETPDSSSSTEELSK